MLIIIEFIITVILLAVLWLQWDERKDRKNKPCVESEPEKKATPITEDDIIDTLTPALLPEKIGEGLVRFSMDGQKHLVCIENHPIFRILMRFTIDPNDIDVPLLKSAANTVTNSTVIGKVDVVIDDDGDQMVDFAVSGLVSTREQFAELFPRYVSLLHELIDRHKMEYNSLKERAKQVDDQAQGAGRALS